MLEKFERLDVRNPFFVEPSAGSGSFLNLLNPKKRLGLDIEPRGKNIRKQNFLEWQYDGRGKNNVVIIGNPPFGRRAKLAIKFFNKSAEFAHTIGFIVPVQFKKYSVHSKLDSSFKLIAEKFLPENSFVTENGNDFDVNCVFQIWTKKDTMLRNKRILSAPPIKHPNFEIYQYNNTKEALKVFQHGFDFAVPRQGYEDYTRREFNAQRLEKNKQWVLFKARDEETKKNLIKLDFTKLAQKNTVVPGFGKADVVEEYIKKYENYAEYFRRYNKAQGGLFAS
ncbi:MAG: SAM-dependent methyltransferase [Parcubacteria group bacterium]|nr:SAM-dependent methyltransferase [Parcubacteria group bacterium]